MESKNTKDVSVQQRQIYVLSLLSENPKGYTIDELRSRLQNWDIEVSKRTLTRDIDELSLNYGIGEDERGGKTYYFADKYSLKNVDLTIGDLASLAFACEVLKDYKHIHMGKQASEFITRMVKQSTSLNGYQFAALASHVQHVERNGRVDLVEESVERQIQNAIENKNKIKINYYSFSSDSDSKRIIHPYRLVLMDANLCVEGFCELRNEVRMFRLSRIQALEQLDDKFGEQPEVDETQRSNLSRLKGGEVENLELVFKGEAIRYVKEYDINKSKRVVEQKDGLHFYAESAITSDVIRWIRSYGPDVKVIEPSWLEDQLIREANDRLQSAKNGE